MTNSSPHNLTTFPVAERFVSINGEGAHAGRLAAFIRFAGCNLRCSYCDTAWAQGAEAASEVQIAEETAETGGMLSLEELVRWVASQPAACVTLTGGEPLLQPALPQLIDTLSALDFVEVVEIETNGSIDLAALPGSRPEKLRITMDYKLPSSGMERHMLPSNFSYLNKADVLKFVAGSREDLEAMTRILAQYAKDLRCRIYISPVAGALEPAEIVDFMKAQRLTQATLQLQLHKIIWPHQERGV